MAAKSKIKAKSKKGIVTAKIMAKHAMMSYDEAKKKGKKANFITYMVAKVGSKIVYEASTSQFLSKNPFVKFQFKGEKGEKLTFTWTDLSGATRTDTKKIK
jgi:sulfur-oxidizing protein SoxZ